MIPDLLESIASLPKEEQYKALAKLTPEELEELDRIILQEEAIVTGKPPAVWVPQPGPQTKAFDSEADELFYGGAAGGGKSDLLLGLAGTKHHHSVIFRREFPEHRALIERSRSIYNALCVAHYRDTYNESLHRWMLPGGRLVEFGALEHEQDKEKWRGRPHDGKFWDEVTQVTESQFRFCNSWCRSTKPGQRCRIVATGNPPTSADGEWIMRYWAPWLDETYPNPAEPGELRWFARLDDQDREVKDGKPFEYRNKAGRVEVIQPRSRTFIPAKLEDNPILDKTGYRATLQGLPEPLRSQHLYGDFRIGLVDHAWQVIPTDWVRRAQARWNIDDGDGKPLDALGIDPHYAGDDSTVIAPRRGNWFGLLKQFKGSLKQPHHVGEGEAIAELIVKEWEPGCQINIEGVSWGTSAYESLMRYQHVVKSSLIRNVNPAHACGLYDKTGKFKLVNVRAALWWKMREALDPEHGEDIALPPDRELLADLCSARWELKPGGIKIEEKDKIKERIGRSCDKADAVILANWYRQGGSVPEPEFLQAIADKMEERDLTELPVARDDPASEGWDEEQERFRRNRGGLFRR